MTREKPLNRETLSVKIVKSFVLILLFPILLFPSNLVVRTMDSTFVLNSYDDGENIYIGVRDFTKLMGGKLFYDSLRDIYVIKDKSRTVKILPESPYFTLNGHIKKFSADALRDIDGCLIPMVSNLSLVSSLVNKRLVYNKSNNSIDIYSNLYDIMDFKVRRTKDRTLVAFTLSRPVKYKYKKRGNKIRVYFYSNLIDGDKFNQKFYKSLVKSVSLGKWKHGRYVVLTLKNGVFLDDVNYSKASGVLQFVLGITRKKDYGPVGKGKFVIVIDPGHGGKDSGAIGPDGIMEKTITLRIAKKLRDYLAKDKAFKIYLTRYDDRFVSLRERTKFALKKKANLFISIHCNASLNRRSKYAKGFETYFLSLARTGWERAVAARENASILYESEKEKKNYNTVDYILSDMAQNQSLIESSKLAESIQNKLAMETNLKDRGVHQAGFYVLRFNYMPAVLVETAFISNEKEEQLLNEDWFEAKLAKAIGDGIKGFVKNYEFKIYGRK